MVFPKSAPWSNWMAATQPQAFVAGIQQHHRLVLSQPLTFSWGCGWFCSVFWIIIPAFLHEVLLGISELSWSLNDGYPVGMAGASGLSLRRVCAGDKPELLWISTCVYSGEGPVICRHIMDTFRLGWLGSILRAFLSQGRKGKLVLSYLLLKEKCPPVFPFFSTNRVALWGPWFAVTSWTRPRLRACWCVSSTSWKACRMVGKNGDVCCTFLVSVFGLFF